MYLNTKYIDVFKYFLNTFVNTFLYHFQNIVSIHSIHYKFDLKMNDTIDIKLVQLYSMSII